MKHQYNSISFILEPQSNIIYLLVISYLSEIPQLLGILVLFCRFPRL